MSSNSEVDCQNSISRVFGNTHIIFIATDQNAGILLRWDEEDDQAYGIAKYNIPLLMVLTLSPVAHPR